MSASDAVAGRISWRELSDLVRALAADRTSRLCAELNGWPGPVDATWLLSALLETTGATVRWPWLAAAEKAGEPDPDAVAAAQQQLLARWG